MQCASDETCPYSDKVGVTEDLVPVYVFRLTSESLNPQAFAFLPFSLQEYAEKGDLCRLRTDDECDTGLIENQIIKNLPEHKKRVFRVLKFLNQNGHSVIEYKIDGKLDKNTRLILYGYYPRCPSYHLRVLFLTLLQNIHGTKADEEITDGQLLMGLLRMLECMCNRRVGLGHPFLSDHPFYISQFMGVADRLLKILCQMMQNKDDEISLLNYKDVNHENQNQSEWWMEDASSIDDSDSTSGNRVRAALALLCCCCQKR